MELEVRTSEGILFAKYRGDLAKTCFANLLDAKEIFRSSTKSLKTLNSDKYEEYLCFIANDHCKLMITEQFELWFGPNDYIKLIR